MPGEPLTRYAICAELGHVLGGPAMALPVLTVAASADGEWVKVADALATITQQAKDIEVMKASLECEDAWHRWIDSNRDQEDKDAAMAVFSRHGVTWGPERARQMSDLRFKAMNPTARAAIAAATVSQRQNQDSDSKGIEAARGEG